MSKKIAVLIGSLRKGSFTRKIVMEMLKQSPSSLEFSIVNIGELPFYNEDLEEQAPKEWISFRETIRGSDGILFATPEYNRSVPAALKNALDVGSRPYGQSVWNNKPAAIISVSPGAIGGFGANHHLRQPFVFLNILCMQQPEAYISNVTTLLNEDGSVKNEKTVAFLKKFMEEFATWVSSILD
jgi:chromate reductase